MGVFLANKTPCSLFLHCFYLSNKFHTNSNILFFFSFFSRSFLLAFLAYSFSSNFKRNPFGMLGHAESEGLRWYLEFTGPAIFNGFWVGSKVTISTAFGRRVGGWGWLNLKEKWCSFHVDKLLSTSSLPESLYPLLSVWAEERSLLLSG
jgi:hypothetical protein